MLLEDGQIGRSSGECRFRLRFEAPHRTILEMTCGFWQEDRMPDPIWVDTNSLVDIIRGDKILEAELVGIRDREGRELLITPKTWDELRNGNVLTQDPQIPQDSQIPNDSARNRVQGLKDRLKFDVDMEGKKLGKYKYKYTDPSEAHLKPEDRKRIDIGQMRRIDDNLRLLDNVSESDSLVLSEVKAGAEVRGIKKPVIFTADRGMTVNARTLGIRPRNPTPRTQAPPVYSRGAGSEHKEFSTDSFSVESDHNRRRDRRRDRRRVDNFRWVFVAGGAEQS